MAIAAYRKVSAFQVRVRLYSDLKLIRLADAVSIARALLMCVVQEVYIFLQPFDMWILAYSFVVL